jgi:hypothetical protein
MEGITVIQAISFYSPIIILISVYVFSVFSSEMKKGLFFIFWFLVATAIRMGIVYSSTPPPGKSANSKTPDICNTGMLLPYTNLTYSTYILCFTFFYFLMPMILINKSNSINYSLIMFFVGYIIFDLFIKIKNKCVLAAIDGGISWISVFMDIVGGVAVGAAVSGLIYSSPVKNNLFINEVNSNNEICTTPSKQQFKCSVYKNGEIVGSTIN